VLQGKVLVAEGVAVYAGHAGAVALHKVAALDHEVLDHPMETGAFVANGNAIRSVLARAELPEVFRRAGHCVRKEFEYHSSDFLHTKGVRRRSYVQIMTRLFSAHRCAYGNVEENDGIVGASQLGLYLIPVRHFKIILFVYKLSNKSRLRFY